MRAILLFACLAFPALAQFSSTAYHIAPGASLPATCSPNSGDVWFKTSATIGMYQCLTANTWTAVGGGGGGGVTGSGVANQISYWTSTSAIGGFGYWNDTRQVLGIGRTTRLSTLTAQAGSSFVISTCTTTANATADITGVGAGCLFTTNIGIGSRIALSSDLTAIGTVTAIISDTHLILDSAYWGDSLGDGTSQTITVYPGTHALWTSGGVPFWAVSSDGHIGGAMNGLPVYDNGSGSGAFTLPDSFVFLQGILTPAIAAIAGAESTLNVDASTALGDATDYSSKGVVGINVAAFHQGTGTTLDAATAIQATAGAGVAGNTVTRATVLAASSFNPGTVGTFTVFKWNAAGGGGTIHNLNIVDCDNEPQVDTFHSCVHSNIAAATSRWSFYSAGTAAIGLPVTTFSALVAYADAAMVYCSDCQVTTVAANVVTNATCKALGSGSVAKRIGGTWKCEYMP